MPVVEFRKSSIGVNNLTSKLADDPLWGSVDITLAGSSGDYFRVNCIGPNRPL